MVYFFKYDFVINCIKCFFFRSRKTPITISLLSRDLVIFSTKAIRADDCLIYRNIKNKEYQITLQKDLNLLENWGNTWGMSFNVAKGNIMRVSRTRDPKLFNYSLTGQLL